MTSANVWTPPRMVPPRAGSDQQEGGRPPKLCPGCSRSECWDKGCQKPEPTAAPEPAADADFERESIQRIVPAANAPSIAAIAALADPFNRRTEGGTAAPDEPAAAAQETPQENEPMPRTPKAPAKRGRRTNGLSPRFQVCSLLMAKGDLSREELVADVSADSKAFQNALANAKAAGHIAFIAKTAKFRLTKEGHDWTSGGANLANHKADVPPPQHHHAHEARAAQGQASGYARACHDRAGGGERRALVPLRRLQRRQLPPGQGRAERGALADRDRRDGALSRTHGRTRLITTGERA